MPSQPKIALSHGQERVAGAFRDVVALEGDLRGIASSGASPEVIDGAMEAYRRAIRIYVEALKEALAE